MNKIEKLIRRAGKEFTALKVYRTESEKRIIEDILHTLDKEENIVRILVWKDYIDVTLKNNATPFTFYFEKGYSPLILSKLEEYCIIHHIEYREVRQ